MTSVEAQAEGDLDELTLLVADNSTSYFGVTHRTGRRIAKPYHAQVMRGGKVGWCTWVTLPPPRRRRSASRDRRRSGRRRREAAPSAESQGKLSLCRASS